MFIFLIILGTLISPRLTLGCVLYHFDQGALAVFVFMWWFLSLIVHLLLDSDEE